jgi:hypothetical protein
LSDRHLRRFPTSSLQDLTRAHRAIGECQGDNLIVSRVFYLQPELGWIGRSENRGGLADIVENNEGSVDAANSVVADPGRHLVRWLSGVAHDGKKACEVMRRKLPVPGKARDQLRRSLQDCVGGS